jgi:hypothetical protein
MAEGRPDPLAAHRFDAATVHREGCMIRFTGCPADRRASARRARFATTLLLLAATRLQAQDSTATAAGGWMWGGSVGMFGVGQQTAPELLTIGLHWTQVRPGHLGADISVGTIPRVVVEGLVVGAARVGVTLPLSVAPGVLLLPTAGVSLIGGAGPGGAGGATGYNFGGAAVLGTGPVGFRTGVTWHRMDLTSSAVWLIEVGLVSRPSGLR